MQHENTHYQNIPVIDMSYYYNDTKYDIKKLANDIKEIYTTIGFAYIINHNVPHNLIDRILIEAKRFHSLSIKEKLSIKQNKSFRGYMPLKSSTTKDSSLKIVTKSPNVNESFIIANNDDYENKIILPNDYYDLLGENQWPISLPDFKKNVTTYNSNVLNLANDLLKIFAMAFNYPYEQIAKSFINPTTILRMLHYPAQPLQKQSEFGFAPHTDSGFLTILLQDEIGGLLVQKTDGNWIDVAPRKYSFILNSGDIVSSFTNGKFISTPHYVKNNYKQSRFSIPFFFDPNMSAYIEPLVPFKDLGNNFEPFIYGKHLLKRLNSNY
jgi:isopenicillin N synthase-like dioxygenase